MNDDTKKVETEELEDTARVERRYKVNTACVIGSAVTEVAGSVAASTIIMAIINGLTGVKYVKLLRFGGVCLGWIVGAALHNPNEAMWRDLEDSINQLCDLYDDYKKSKALGINFKEYVKINNPELVKEA